MSDPIPPIVAAKATPSINAVPKPRWFGCAAAIAEAMGARTMADAVLLIHRLRKAVAAITAARSFRGAFPANSISVTAILVWRPDLTIARARRNPPRNSTIRGST